VAPLVPAEGALVIDSTALNIEQVVDLIFDHINNTNVKN
jgi:cytidylate kinase